MESDILFKMLSHINLHWAYIDARIHKEILKIYSASGQLPICVKVAIKIRLRADKRLFYTVNERYENISSDNETFIVK